LFGKINLLDLAIVLVVLALGARFGYRFVNPNAAAPAGQDKPLEVTILLPEVRQPTIDQLQKGVEVRDSKSGTVMGTIVEVKTVPSQVTGPQGEFISQYRFDHFVTLRGPGRVTDTTVMLNGLEMKVGRTNYMVTDLWAGGGPTWEINENPPNR